MEGDKSLKLKILYIMKMLENTDEENPITMKDILSELDRHGIRAERKSVYSDFEQLRLFGLDVIKEQRNRTSYYYLGKRPFELAELKLLVDSVQAYRFMTEKKSNELIKKIEGLTGKHSASELQHQVFVTGRVKTDNEKILYTVDAIHRAISENTQISFKYGNWSVDKTLVPRTGADGADKQYLVSPWSLTMAEENYYYLVAFDANDARNKIKYFRVDKMIDVSLTGTPREGRKEIGAFDIAEYAKKRFRMYDGEERAVKLKCSNKAAGIIIDRFGRDVMLHKLDKEHFSVTVNVAVSRQFYSWILSMNDLMELVWPLDVVEDLKEFIRDCARKYEREDKPLIGVTPLFDEKLDSQWMLPEYFESICEAGGIPVMLPLVTDEEEVLGLVNSCDGILFTGGQDVSAFVYGADENDERIKSFADRDIMETLVLKYAMSQDKPVLGICRGLQFMNAALAGTLYQDLPTQHESETVHSQKAPYDKPVHEVKVVPGTLLHEILEKNLKDGGRLLVNSRHHQAVKDIAPELEVCAVSEDGVIEGAYRPDSRFFLGVQWHPEHMHVNDKASKDIFDCFVSKARKK